MKSFLDKIQSPSDIKDLSVEELEVLAFELRQRIIEVMSVSGGHLSSNLGSIELSIGLHKEFDSPRDNFIFDVSHQTYAHKIITGRNSGFETIRKYKGLSGFANPLESDHDPFFAGHAGTALSLGLGCAKARDLSGEDHYVIPILGDASLTCGHTFESLNNLPKNLKRFIIILNDNAMSISKNVGAITNILSRFINHPTANKAYHEIESALAKMPGFGPFLASQGHKVTESLKNIISTAPFFEQYGLSYVGPIDGHNIKQVTQTLNMCKSMKQPVLIHALTVKGKGMEEATKYPTTYHGVKPFDIKTGKFLPKPNSKLTFPKCFGNFLLELFRKNPHLVCITPAMPAGSCLTEILQEFPERCLDVGIAEGHSVTFAGGIAKDRSKKVIVSIYSTFLQRAFDNLFHDVCLQNLPVIFAIDRGGIAGGDGVTHNGLYDLGFLKAMPNMIIAQPRNSLLLKELMKSALKSDQPFAIRYPNLETEEISSEVKDRTIGKGEVLAKGKTLVIIALGHKVNTALEVAKKLSQDGVKATIVDPIFIKPLDSELFTSLFKTHDLVVTLEEHSVVTGLGDTISSFILEKSLKDKKLLTLGVPDEFIHHGSHQELSKELKLDTSSVYESIVGFLETSCDIFDGVKA